MKQQKSGSKFPEKNIIGKIAVLLTGAAILLSACENNLEQIKAFPLRKPAGS
jgi:hypothetical protein